MKILYWPSFVFVCSALYAAVALNIYHSSKQKDSDDLGKQIIRLDAIVNVFAASCYAAILSFPSAMRNIRYTDWIVTCPILMLIMCNLSDRARQQSDPAPNSSRRGLIVLFTTLMLACGWYGNDQLGISYVLGFVAFACAFYLLNKEIVLEDHPGDSEETLRQKEFIRKLYFVSVLIWSLYGVSYLLPLTYRNMSYNCLDLFSKGGLAVLLFNEI